MTKTEEKVEKTEAEQPSQQAPSKKVFKGRELLKGIIVHINATFNNTIVTVTDRKGNVKAWSSAGKCGFKGSKKATPYAAQQTANDVFKKLSDKYKIDNMNVVDAEVWIIGPGIGRESALRGIKSNGVNIKVIRDKTYNPYNGCRPKKKRRV